MSALRRALARELRHLSRDRWDLGAVTLLPAILLALMAAMLFGGVPRQLPIAIVDEDQSAISRALIRDVTASPTVMIVSTGGQLAPAFHLVREERAWAVMHIPRGMEEELVRQSSPAPHLHIFYQASFLSTGSVVARAIEETATASLAAHLPELLSSHGVPALHISPPTVQATILYNSGTSFEWYLTVLIDPAVLHLLVACVSVMALGREARDGSFGEWARQSGGVTGALIGKMLPYVVIATVWGAAWLIWLTLFRGWRVEGSLAVLMLGQALLFAGTTGISALLVALTRKASVGLSASAIYAGSALAYSGATLPLNGGSRFARLWSELLPLTHYIEMQMGQYIGAPLRAAAPQLGILVLYVLLGGGAASLLLSAAARNA